MIHWLDLYTADDPHPRRFDSADRARDYLVRVERLSGEAADTLIRQGQLGPPDARREYRLRALGPSGP